METILNASGVHEPYAIGLLKWFHQEEINQLDISTWFSEDHMQLSSYCERSRRILSSFVKYVEQLVRKQRRSCVVYFHNMSRFDGIILLKHLINHHTNYTLKPLMRNGVMYEIKVFYSQRHSMIFRDSCQLLPGSLASLAKDLCPELGGKGEIDHESICLSNLVERKDELLRYMIQDIVLLAGIMLKAQAIISTEFGYDIVDKITVSSLALTIFRTKFYDDSRNPIYIPSANEDNFLRRAYYGGHSDVYIPYLKDGHYYDVNSLYPYIMAEFVMPIGKPTWHGNLSNQSLDEIYGFVEAYVVCPLGMRSPYLPYREKDGSLTHPVGEFFGVYYTEELKKAREVGYKVEPLRGYLFERGKGVFTSYVLHMYDNRRKAQEQGQTGMSFVYKILMNGLYGRLGKKTKSTITELCTWFNEIRKLKYEIVSEEPMNDTTIMCSYWYKPEEGSADWYRKLAAVQMSAAITAQARVYMYGHISREDCYYTDTDSVVVKKPLP